MEEFRAVKGFEGLYEVSNNGRLKSLARKDGLGRQMNERILKTPESYNGYSQCTLRKDNKSHKSYMHQLVAIAFLGHEPNGHKIVVDHINGDPLNNRADNLQLVTQRKNTSKDKKGGSSKYIGVCWGNAAKKWLAHICIGGKPKYLGRFTEELEAAEAYQLALTQLA